MCRSECPEHRDEADNKALLEHHQHLTFPVKPNAQIPSPLREKKTVTHVPGLAGDRRDTLGQTVGKQCSEACCSSEKMSA